MVSLENKTVLIGLIWCFATFKSVSVGCLRYPKLKLSRNVCGEDLKNIHSNNDLEESTVTDIEEEVETETDTERESGDESDENENDPNNTIKSMPLNEDPNFQSTSGLVTAIHQKKDQLP